MKIDYMQLIRLENIINGGIYQGNYKVIKGNKLVLMNVKALTVGNINGIDGIIDIHYHSSRELFNLNEIEIIEIYVETSDIWVPAKLRFNRG